MLISASNGSRGGSTAIPFSVCFSFPAAGIMLNTGHSAFSRDLQFMKCEYVNAYMHKKNYNGTRRLGVESLELRMMLTGEGVDLPVVSMVPSAATELIPTSDEDITRAVAVDLNGDGQLDYAATLSGQTRRLVFLVADDGGYSSLNMPTVTDNQFEDIDFGDINGDGLLDVVAVAEKVVHTYINLGFSPDSDWLGMQPHEQVRISAKSLSVADLNDDGRDDLVLGTEQRVDVRIANFEGKFLSGIWYLNTKGLKIVTSGDVNDDGHVDVVANSVDTESIEVLLNDGQGFLAESQSIPDVDPTKHLELLDVNGDTHLDLIVGGQNQYHDNVHIWNGTASGTLVNNGEGFETVGAPQDFALGDINGDEIPDLVVGHGGTFHHPTNDNGPGGVSILLATSPGVFQDPVRVVTPGARALTIADVGAGAVITAVSNSNNELVTLSWSDNQLIDAAHDFSEPDENMFQHRNSVFGDFNGDGMTDAVVANRFNEVIDGKLFLGNVDGTFTVTPLLLDPIPRVFELFVGDFNGDDVDDLGIQVDFSDTQLFSLISNGDGTFQAAQSSALGAVLSNRQVVDINQDGRDDLVATEGASTTTWVMTALADENGRWVRSAERLELNSQFVAELRIQDLNGDDQLDLIASSFQGVETALGIGDGTFAASQVISMEASFQAIGDFNGDGLGDVIGAGFGEIQLTAAYGTEEGGYQISTDVPLDFQLANPQGLQAVDLEGDGVSELVVIGLNELLVLRSDGSGGFTSEAFATGFFAARLFVQEVTGDNHLDLIAAPGMNFIGGSPTMHITVYPGSADGGLEAPMHAAASMIDGQLISIEKNANRVEFLISNRFGFGRMTGSLSAGLVGDFNGDGQISSDDMDLLCAAAHAAALPPAEVARFDQNGDDQINAEDIDEWLANVANTKRGDADLDGDVDFADFLELSANFGSEDGHWSEGDFNCDGVIGFSDFLLLSSNFGV